MRKIFFTVVAAVAGFVLLMPTAANASTRHRNDVSIGISPLASKIYLARDFVPNPDDHTLYKSVDVYARLNNCPAGSYFRSFTLVQNGVSFPSANFALAGSELYCNADNASPNIPMYFFDLNGKSLHAGFARVTVTVYGQDDNVVLVQKSQLVFIPGGKITQR